nr:MAG TPA: hypothetical protein [Caudoviricetes sp.]
MIETHLSVKEIEHIIVNFFGGVRANIIVPNLSFGFLNHEADLVIVGNNGYLTEVEIKRSFEDFKADFKKEIYHDTDERVSYFGYFVPKIIQQKCMDFNKEHAKDVTYNGRPYAVFGFTDDGKVYDKDGRYLPRGRFGASYNPNARKLFLEERLKIAHLGCMRLYPNKKNNNNLTFLTNDTCKPF